MDRCPACGTDGITNSIGNFVTRDWLRASDLKCEVAQLRAELAEAKKLLSDIRADLVARAEMDDEDGGAVLNADSIQVGEYIVRSFGAKDFWIENAAGEGMQVFAINFERLIGDFFKDEF